MIPKILISLPTSPIIYLTGHTNKNFLSLEQKIRYLTESNLNDAIILVDQAQLFEKPIIKVNQSLHKPSLQLLVRKLQLTNPLYYQLKEIIPFLKGRGPEEFSSKSEECEILIGRYNSIINSLYRLIIGLLVDDIMNPILLNKNQISKLNPEIIISFAPPTKAAKFCSKAYLVGLPLLEYS